MSSGTCSNRISLNSRVSPGAKASSPRALPRTSSCTCASPSATACTGCASSRSAAFGHCRKGAPGVGRARPVSWYGVREGIQGIGQASQDVRGRPGRSVERVLEIRPDQVAQVSEGGEVR